MNFHLSVNGKVEGPYSFEELAARGVTHNTPVWHEGMADWLPAADIPELAHLLTPERSPPMPPRTVPPSLPIVPASGPTGTAQTGLPASGGYLPYSGHVAPHGLSETSVVLMYLLTILTLGLYPFFHFNMMHGGLPKVRPNDPSAGAAVGFHFIPLFNIYWMIFVHLRLVDRINEQRRIAGLAESSVRGFLVTTMVFNFIPILNFAAPVLFLTYYGWLQTSVNELARCSRR